MKRCRPLLGTMVEITGDDDATIALGFERIERVHFLMSAHDPSSELSTINCLAAQLPVELDPLTVAVIRRALDWARRSGGAFDIVAAGSAALRSGKVRRHAGQPEPDPAADWTAVRIDQHEVSLACPACLDLGGIAKGFAVDLAVERMIDAGASRGLVNAGGDLRGFGDEQWPVAVLDPQTRRPLLATHVADQALATSAGHPSNADELNYSHLPGADGKWESVTVRASNACDADALTKVLIAGASLAARCLEEAGAQAVGIGRDGLVKSIAQRHAGRRRR